MIRDDAFEWDAAKARRNYAKHGVSFATAKQSFADPLQVVLIDDREEYGEDRFMLLGAVDGQILSIVYTERQERYRLISARHATRYEKDEYFKQNQT
jgi:hypothetical protein